MKRRTTLLFAIFLSGVLPLEAQTLLREARFSPAIFYVGDKVDLVLHFDLEKELPLIIPDILPKSDWVEIRAINVTSTEKELFVSITFIPFAPGTRSLPLIDLGKIELKNIKVSTHSLLQSGHEGTRQLRGQLLLPGARLTLALILACLTLAPLGLYMLGRFSWAHFLRYRKNYITSRPIRRMHRLVKELSLNIDTLSAAHWYGDLTDALRHYLSARTGWDCRTATTAEIAVFPGFTDQELPAGRILCVLKEGDLVKFARQKSNKKNQESSLMIVEKAMLLWEEQHKQQRKNKHAEL